MSKVRTYGTVLKNFQQEAVENGTTVLATCLMELGKLNRDHENYDKTKKLIVSDVGALLFEAPTGSGKTLMAGNVATNISQLHNTQSLPKVVWFWFAPFAGLIDQTIRTIRTEFSTLRPKNPTVDREPSDLKSGDVFVTTWASVAVSNEASRKARTGTEVMPSIDELVNYARSQGFVIGVVIDEAHHSFRGQSQAFSFYKSVLAPELTILVTATPRDNDIDVFVRNTGITNLRRITVSRQQAIEERLIKEGVKVAVFKAPTDVEGLIDFKRTALKQGVATHNRLKKSLNEIGQTVVPLLLVQVDSEEGSVEQAVTWLKEMGFRLEGDSGLIRTHTADEPDPYLSIISTDESVEVLIFKMAVATGFDVPRAFTLVSFRPNRDDDFGVQIVGRILRVDRRLQIVEDLPEPLKYGYVYLSNKLSQTGLTSAAQRINQMKSELASVAVNINVVPVEITRQPELVESDDGSHLKGTTDRISDEFGSPTLDTVVDLPKPLDIEDDIESKTHQKTSQEVQTTLFNYSEDIQDGEQEEALQKVLLEKWGLENNYASEKPYQRNNTHRYDLNRLLGSPTVFRKGILSLNNIDIVSHIVSRFRFDDDALLVAHQSATKILQEEVEIFHNRKDRPAEIRADLAQKEIDARAQQTLFTADDYDVINMRELHAALENQLRIEVDRKGIDHLFDTDEKYRSGLHKILALRPTQLKRAISETVAMFTESKEVEPIPEYIISDTPLDPARLNIYGVFPADLNAWERKFAEYLDDDLLNIVKWWHRNPSKKPFSVTMPLPGQPNFYPDFIVGINGRTRGNGILLVETKRMINDQERNALVKAQAVHPDYEKIMMLYWENNREWRVVEYDPATDKNYLDRILRPELMVVY